MVKNRGIFSRSFVEVVQFLFFEEDDLIRTKEESVCAHEGNGTRSTHGYPKVRDHDWIVRQQKVEESGQIFNRCQVVRQVCENPGKSEVGEVCSSVIERRSYSAFYRRGKGISGSEAHKLIVFESSGSTRARMRWTSLRQATAKLILDFYGRSRHCDLLEIAQHRFQTSSHAVAHSMKAHFFGGAENELFVDEGKLEH